MRYFYKSTRRTINHTVSINGLRKGWQNRLEKPKTTMVAYVGGNGKMFAQIFANEGVKKKGNFHLKE